MGSMGPTESDYEWVTRRLMRVARTYCEGRIVSVLEAATTCPRWRAVSPACPGAVAG